MYHRLNIKAKTIKFQEETLKNPCAFGISKNFLGYKKTQTIKEKNDKLNFGKIEIFYLRDTIKKMKGQAKDLEKIFAIHISDKRLFQNT